MKFLPLIWMNVWRRRTRTVFTLLSILIAFLLFGVVMTVRNAFAFGVELAGMDRLVLINKITLIMPLPISYQQQIERTPGVEAVTHQTWFNGAYQEPTNILNVTAVDAKNFLDIYAEYKIPEEQVKAWRSDRQGAVVGRDLANRYGWKVGDRVPMQSSIWQAAEPWQFNISGIYDADAGVDKTQFFFRYDYLDENRSEGLRGNVGWYIVRIGDPAHAVELGEKFDTLFANSGAETKTTTEKGFIEGFAKQVGDIGTITVAIASTVLFMFGLVAASTMVQSVRERTNELAVLKTLGYRDATILVLVLVESLFVTVLGGGVGLGLAWLFVQQGDPTGGLLPLFAMPTSTLIAGALLMVLMGLLAGMAPAIGAMRLQITDALRKT
jgi:putative ABC transport system permease protein